MIAPVVCAGTGIDRRPIRFKEAEAWFWQQPRTLKGFMKLAISETAGIFHWEPGRAPLVWYLPAGHISVDFYGDKFRLNAVGTQGLPDKEFNDAACAPFMNAIHTDQPIHDHVRGVCEAVVVDYNRIIMPLDDGYLATAVTDVRIFGVHG